MRKPRKGSGKPASALDSNSSRHYATWFLWPRISIRAYAGGGKNDAFILSNTIIYNKIAHGFQPWASRITPIKNSGFPLLYHRIKLAIEWGLIGANPIFTRHHIIVMARQSGPIPIEGTLGDLIFYKTIHGHLVRRKGSLDKQRVMSDPAFERSRAAGSEFGRAGAASGLIRRAVKQYCPYAGDGQTHSRLSKLLGSIIRADSTHPAGERQVIAENIGPLKGFEWIQDHPLSRSFWAQCGGSMTPEGVLTITMTGFTPKRDLGWPLNATHAQLTVVCISARFPEGEADSASAQSGRLMKSTVAINLALECSLPVKEGAVTMAGIGVQFFEGETALNEGAAFGIVG